MFFFYENVERLSDLRKCFYETSIKIAEFYERSDLLQIDESVSFFNDFDFCRIHSDVIHRNDQFEIFNFDDKKFAFVYICLKIRDAKFFEHFFHIYTVFFTIFTINQNIV